MSAHDVQLDQGDETHLYGENILIATGSVPARPPIPGLSLPNVITSDELLEDPSCTQHLEQEILIIGGGVIGVEFASVFSSFGCKVTIVEAMERILPTMGSGNFSEFKHDSQKTRCRNLYWRHGGKA